MGKCSVCGKKLNLFQGYKLDDVEYCDDCYPDKEEDYDKEEEEEEYEDDEPESFLDEYKGKEKKWIKMDITIMVPYANLIPLKSALKPYAEELDWKIDSGHNKLVQEDGKKRVEFIDISMEPNGGNISPIKFLNKRAKIFGLLFSINRDLIYGGDEKKAIKNSNSTLNLNYTRLEGHKPNKKDYTLSHALSFLNFSYNLVDRTEFEKRNKELAIKLFGYTAEEDIKSIFKEKSGKNKKLNKEEKEVEESSKEMKKEIEYLFGWKL